MLNPTKLDKEELRKEFSKNYKSYYSTKLFEQENFQRRECIICGKFFWSIKERDTCDDPSHTPYSFFKHTPRKMKYKDMWDKFSHFFRRNKHSIINRYPVVSRWRQDLYFTIASIQDFQRIENGAMGFEYNANPLIVPQICLRFSDIDNVGVTGRHLTSFMMAGQHAFNYPKEGYWRDRTIELNYKFLTEVLGVKKEDLTYNEDAWAMGDFSEFGPCLESFANGAELVNSVFTQFESVDGKIKELKGKVVDVGWGFERLLWFYTGFDNVYEAVFYDIINKIQGKVNFDIDNETFKRFSTMSGELDVTEKNNRTKESDIIKKLGISQEDYEKKIKPTQALYAVLDHTKTLLFAITDGALPSNVGGGYNLRVILRRAISFIEEYDMRITLNEIAEMQIQELKSMYPELIGSLDLFSKVLDVERKRYSKTGENARKIISNMVSNKEEFSKERLRVLYESHGITPEMISSVASKKETQIEIPEGAYEEIMKGDFVAKRKEGKIKTEIPEKLPKTKQLYYDFATESKSKALFIDKNHIVLDKTPFYPEGGGQEPDHGTINGIKIIDVQKVGGVIVHVAATDGHGVSKGKIVDCKIDTERRARLMAHHTSTHLISAAARSILGKHAWQEGAKKGAEKAHIDIAHYDKLTEHELKEIEKFVNSALLSGIKVNIEEMERGKAESRYGFSIYQGHGMPTKTMRIVVIKDSNGKLLDAEACGGMHVVSRESSIGLIKIINSYRIHDGVDRIEFVAGKAALDYFQREHNELANIAEKFNSDVFHVGEKEAKFREEHSSLLKRLAESNEKVAGALANMHLGNIKEIKESDFILEIDEPKEIIRKIVSKLIGHKKDATILIKNKKGEFVCMSGKDSDKNALEFAKERLGSGFRGGGSKHVAEGIIA